MGKAETAERLPNLVTMRSSLQAELEKRFNFDENNKYLVATFDPRFKTSFLGLVQAERARRKNSSRSSETKM
ncbi:jg18143 [Pararge aegeria aegeria]|uniref:Jg18143 protein n=1 Tax=Pararge aegeria aegeria TaxID=348720 RepID=A0A8S4R7D1_9NEOP|nr:jg18143 [Pararge aegeria aegeria]